MWAIALMRLGTTAELEAAALATDLGMTAFEAGQLVRGHLPSILQRTADPQRAQQLVARLRQRGHDAQCCDEDVVVAAEAMHEVRGFRFDPDALVSLNQNGTSERLPYADITALVRATHRQSGADVETTREKKFSLGRAVATQGLLMSKTVVKQTVTEAQKREPVLYLFRRDGAPWLVSETRGRYDGLGPDLRPGRLENFNTLVKKLRERLPAVPFDERLVQVRAGGERVSGDLVGAQRSTSNASTVDLLAHLVAADLTSGRAAGRSSPGPTG